MADETHDDIDHALDAALTKYAAAEPRTGLEHRVLARLRIEQARTAGRAWWSWSLAAAALAVVMIGLVVGWKSGRPSAPGIASHPAITPQSPPRPEAEMANRDGVNVPPRVHPTLHAATHRSAAVATIAAAPKLEVFPSPRPLTEQEKLLVGYIAEEPEHAVLLARAQAEDLRRDQEEEMRGSGSGNGENSQQLSK
jgi:hypothetical protein